MTTEQQNQLVFACLSRFLNERPDAIDASQVLALQAACGVPRMEAAALLLAAACGLDVAENAEHRALYQRYFARMLRALDAPAYRENPYLQTIRLPACKDGAWELRREHYQPYELFVRDDPETLPDGRIVPSVGYFTERFDYPAVLENGREWMLITPNEIATMRPAIEAARGRVLTYGLGLGYFAFMAARKPEVERVTVVERDAAVLRLFRKHVLPSFPHADKLELVQADAFDFARERMADGRYTLVFTDLWHDPSDGVPLYLQMKDCERFSPQSEFLYWIEKTLRLYLA